MWTSIYAENSDLPSCLLPLNKDVVQSMLYLLRPIYMILMLIGCYPILPSRPLNSIQLQLIVIKLPSASFEQTYKKGTKLK